MRATAFSRLTSLWPIARLATPTTPCPAPLRTYSVVVECGMRSGVRRAVPSGRWSPQPGGEAPSALGGRALPMIGRLLARGSRGRALFAPSPRRRQPPVSLLTLSGGC